MLHYLKRIRNALLVLALFGICLWWTKQIWQVFIPEYLPTPEFILDPGHGGEDGGALSISGEKESNLNLEITLKLDQILGLLGRQSILTREDDTSLHDPGAVTLREKKRADLKKRVEIANEYPESTVISIHQNFFQDSKYWGTQAFYADTSGSMEVAKIVQKEIKILQPNNSRESKQIHESVYLMNHIENTAVLIECGFLSNLEEERLLLKNEYQKKLALVFGAALTNE